MVLEHFTPANVAVNTDFNAKLFEGGYPSAPGVRSGDEGKGKDKAPSEGDFAVRYTKDSSDTRNRRLDDLIQKTFGEDVLKHLNDWDWLIANEKKLKDGFSKDMKDQDKWDMAWRMRELSKVDGEPLIYLKKLDGPTTGNLIPKRHDINLRRGRIHFSDDYIGQVYH
jgi:hypothetical protein